MDVITDNIPENIINREKYGLISIRALLNSIEIEDLRDFAAQFDIFIDEKEKAQREKIIKELIDYFLQNPKHKNPMEHLGTWILMYKPFKPLLKNFDFISKSELINKFADYCADLKINVYDATDDSYDLDLYLTKKKFRLRTESVFILTGDEVDEKYNEKLFQKIENAGEICDWRVIVTTPLGAVKIGYDNFVQDLKKLDAWGYIIDPFQKRVLGVIKGGKSNNKDKDKRDKYIRTLPQQPIRAPSQVVNISEYKWNERDAYSPENIAPFYFISKDGTKFNFDEQEKKFHDIFRQLLIISLDSGLPIYSFSSKTNQVDESLISSFLNALESFMKQLSTGSGLNEIDYQSLKISGASTKRIQIVAMTSKSPGKEFHERLMYLCNLVENEFSEEIDDFIESGNRNIFNKSILDKLIKEILAI